MLTLLPLRPSTSPGEVTWDDPRSQSPDDGTEAQSYDPFGGDSAGDDGRVNSPAAGVGGEEEEGAATSGGGGKEHRASAIERSSFFNDEDETSPYVYDDDNSTDSGIGALNRWNGGDSVEDVDGGADDGAGDEGDDAFDWSQDVNGDDELVMKRSLSSSGGPKPWHKKDVADGNSHSFIYDD